MNLNVFCQYPTGNLSNADASVQCLDAGIKPLIPGKRIAGRIRTAQINAGQNGAIHRAAHRAQTGDILVISGEASERFGPFGDLLAECCLARGLDGAVLDCMIRDSTEIAAMGFQVFCRGFHPEATAKTEPGIIDQPIIINGITINPGDIIVGDDDGVVTFPADNAEQVYENVQAVAAREETIRARILAGESTCDIFGIAN